MSESGPPGGRDGGETDELFARYLDQRLDDDGRRRLEDLLREDPAARERCAGRLLFEADLKGALAPDELEWLETRRVRLARHDGRPSMEIQRREELRVGPPRATVAKGRRLRGLLGGAAVLGLVAAAWIMSGFLHPTGAPLLRNAGFETTDLSLNPTGNTDALIDWQDYFTTPQVDLCEIARVTGGRIFPRSGRNVARMKAGAHLTQRLRDEHGKPILARPGSRYLLSGWAFTDGQGPHVLRAALRVVASGRPAMIQYEAVQQRIELPSTPGWQPFRIEFELAADLQREPSDVTIDERPVLDLAGRELTLSLDSRGGADSLYYLDDLAFEAVGGKR
jgi:hypothetical protein